MLARHARTNPTDGDVIRAKSPRHALACLALHGADPGRVSDLLLVAVPPHRRAWTLVGPHK
jgi:hypothetical protein